MKILQTEITPIHDSHISIIKRDEPYFNAPFHFHPELELVYIKESTGKRIIGDKVEHFEAGDMVFVGSNLPHVWLNDEIYYKGLPQLQAKAIVIYFNVTVLAPVFYDMKETTGITNFFKRGERGIQITGKTKEIVAAKMETIVQKEGFEKIITLFDIFNILSISEDIRYITSEGYKHNVIKVEGDRLSEVYKYVQEHFNQNISMVTAAHIACLTPQSFCRMFKKRTNKHFVEYLNEVRISKACSLLLDTDWSVSEIAYKCGYKTVSNFNKTFKEITGSNPKVYRGNIVKP